VSGTSNFDTRKDELAKAGIAEFVAKPWDNQKLLALLRALAPKP
jgi:hypothetical protein